MSEKDILDLIREDKWMMDILRAVEKLNLPDWWIGAGFVRSKIWDYLHNYTNRTPLPDIDLIYFNPKDFTSEEEGGTSTRREQMYEELLRRDFPNIKWSVTNQARMHHMHKRSPYKNSEEALSEWSETATCVGVKLRNGKLILTAPHGTSDLVNLVIRPIPGYDKKYKHDPDIFKQRLREKKWLRKWPKLRLWKDKD